MQGRARLLRCAGVAPLRGASGQGFLLHDRFVAGHNGFNRAVANQYAAQTPIVQMASVDDLLGTAVTPAGGLVEATNTVGANPNPIFREPGGRAGRGTTRSAWSRRSWALWAGGPQGPSWAAKRRCCQARSDARRNRDHT